MKQNQPTTQAWIRTEIQDRRTFLVCWHLTTRAATTIDHLDFRCMATSVLTAPQMSMSTVSSLSAMVSGKSGLISIAPEARLWMLWSNWCKPTASSWHLQFQRTPQRLLVWQRVSRRMSTMATIFILRISATLVCASECRIPAERKARFSFA